MSRYVSRPIVIEAVQISALLGTSFELPDGLPMWVYTSAGRTWSYADAELLDGVSAAGAIGIWIDTLNGAVFAGPTEYLVRGTQGELYPCARDIFEAKYEAVE